MPRAGRSLEEFVREIERLLANSPVEIRSPDFVMGQYSRSRREIDVSLRAKDDPDRILLMIECRDRQDVQDVAWIDGIIGNVMTWAPSGPSWFPRQDSRQVRA